MTSHHPSRLNGLCLLSSLGLMAGTSIAQPADAPSSSAGAPPDARPTHPSPATPQRDAETAPKWTLQVDPLTTLLGFVHVQVERRLHDHFSVYLGPSLHLFNAPWQEQEPYRGYGAEIGLRYFYAGCAPQGWWSQLRGVGAYLETSDGSDRSSFGGYVSVLSGYTGVVDGWLVLAAGLGVQFLDYRIADYGLFGVAPAAHSTVGVAF